MSTMAVRQELVDVKVSVCSDGYDMKDHSLRCTDPSLLDIDPRCDVVGRSFFFFQAEDGIRDVAVTGVQTVCSSDLLGNSLENLLAKIESDGARAGLRVKLRLKIGTDNRERLFLRFL